MPVPARHRVRRRRRRASRPTSAGRAPDAGACATAGAGPPTSPRPRHCASGPPPRTSAGARGDRTGIDLHRRSTVPSAAIARAEIDRRAKDKHIPQLAVRAALAIHSTDGRSYAERIAALRSELQMSLLYEELIGRVPLGQRLFANANPVRTGGPMQVSIAFAEHHAREHGYPYEPADGSIRHEVFSRRGGMYFGIAHLLGYPASYDQPIYRYAVSTRGFTRAAMRHSRTPSALPAHSARPRRRPVASGPRAHRCDRTRRARARCIARHERCTHPPRTRTAGSFRLRGRRAVLGRVLPGRADGRPRAAAR